jgi:hypothetical protein
VEPTTHRRRRRPGWGGRRLRLVLAWCATFVVGIGVGLAIAPLVDRVGEESPEEAHDGRDTRAEGDCRRPYTASSPWNTPIPEDATVVDTFRIAHDPGATLTSDPTQYTYPVYSVTRKTPRKPVELRGLFSMVTADKKLEIIDGGTVRLPLPRGVEAAAGTDGQFVVVDWDTGEEWGVWKARRDADGSWSIENGYRYNVRWDGVPPKDATGRPFISRGAGVPYLTGLVRPCEIKRRRIDHALAFAYDYPSGRHVYPATKSDGLGDGSDAVPEGTRLQLDPSLTTRDLANMSCTKACLTIARALQRYGMYVIDNSGRPKVMMEYDSTARWNRTITDETLGSLRLKAFRVLKPMVPEDARSGA